jgi:hypothetical protein
MATSKKAKAKKPAKKSKPAKKPATKSKPAKKPAAKKSAAKKSAAKKPAAKKPAAKKPAKGQPVSAASTESLTAEDVRQRLQPLVGEATLENPEMSLPLRVFDWAAMETDERNSFAFTHLYMFNFARGGNGERIVFDGEYLPIGELTLDDDKLAILCELATGATFLSGGHTSTDLHPFAPSLDALVTRIRVGS